MNRILQWIDDEHERICQARFASCGFTPKGVFDAQMNILQKLKLEILKIMQEDRELLDEMIDDIKRTHHKGDEYENHY